MLSSRQKKAVKLMFQMPEEQVAAAVGVRLDTLTAWRDDPEFREALGSEERALRDAAARITSDAALAAARNLHRLAEEGKDGKLSLDILKASGAFEPREDGAEEALAAIVRKAAGDEAGS